VRALFADLPRAEKCLAGFAVLGFLCTAFGLWAGVTDQAYAAYYRNHVIRAIQLGASGVDLGILLVLAGWRWFRLPRWSAAVPLSLLVLVGAWLTWFEMWYGSTFYYGEVRDKQGLPVMVNNFGIVGSFAFLAYLIWGLPLGRMRSGWSIAVRCAFTLLLLLGHQSALGRVFEPWKIYGL
jgi:hypothetical protein